MKYPKNFVAVVFIASFVFLLAACGGAPQENTSSNDQVSTSVHETTSALAAERAQASQLAAQSQEVQPTAAPTEEPILPTDTPAPTDTPEPTETPSVTETPTETPIPEDGRVAFPTGGSFITIREQIAEKKTDEYRVNIQQGQVLSVLVESDGQTPVLALLEEDGKERLSASKEFTWYITNVQKTQDFTIQVVSGDFTTDYILHISTPIDVSFDAGATSKTYEGELEAGDIIEYKVHALMDQKAEITLTSTSGLARLYVYGLSSRLEYVDYSDDAVSWESVMPETQTYLIKVIANDADTDYTLTVEITD